MFRFASVGKNLLLLCVSLFCMFLVAEVFLRMLGIGYPYWSRVDPLTGFSPRPGVSGWVQDEGLAFVRINSAGFRDREHDLMKPENTVRIAVLGDSFTEAKQVDVADTFWSVLERRLPSCPALAGKKVEVLNFGVSGYGTAQEWLLLERVWPYAPDAVLVAFFAGNDIGNNSRELEKSTQKPYVDEKNGVLVPDFSFRDTAFYKSQTSWKTRTALSVVDHSRVAQLVAEAHRSIRRRAALKTAQTNASGAVVSVPGLDPGVNSAPKDDAARRAWDLTERLLTDMYAKTKDRGARFAVATVPTGMDIHPDPAVRKAYEQSLHVSDLFYSEDRIIALGQREAFPVIPLGHPMQHLAEQTKTLFNGAEGMGHWNAAGHEAAGAIIAESLCGLLAHR